FAELVGTVDAGGARRVADQAARAKRAWGLTRRLAKELRRDLQPDEEVFLAKVALTRHPSRSKPRDHRYEARLVLARSASAEVSRINRWTGAKENAPVHAVTPTIRVREIDRGGLLVQEFSLKIGTAKAADRISPAELIELFGELDPADLIAAAN